MSSVLALRLLGKTIKYSSVAKTHGIFMKYNTTILPATQCMGTIANTTINSPKADNNEWRIIYRLPLIRLASAFNRVKVSYGMLNAIIIPAAVVLEQSSQLPQSTAILVGVVGVTSWCTLAICSLFIRNLIGVIYINDNNDKLKLAYVDYWGKRHDVSVDLDDIIPQGETSKLIKFDFYQSLCLYSDEKVHYKLLQKFGEIEDLATFTSIFGE